MPRVRRLLGLVGHVACKLHHGAGRPQVRARQPADHTCRPQAHQGARARPVAQGPGAGRDGGAAGAVKGTRGDLQQGRGRMIDLEDRQALAQDIGAAHSARARLRPACEIAGIDMRTLQRWKAQDGLSAGDGRPQALRHTAGHALSPQDARADRILTDGSFAATPRRGLDDDSQPRLATRPAVCEPLSLGGYASRRDSFARCHVPNSVQARIGAGGQGAQQWPRP